MKTKVVFNTFIGRIAVDADYTLSINEEFLNGETEAIKDNISACVSLDKDNSRLWKDGHKKYNIDLTLAVCGDIRTLQKQNEEYASKEDNGRHHVDLNTLVVREIWIDGKYLRIRWCFADCYGTCRAFAGNIYPITESYNDTNKENFYCGSEVNLQVYF